MNMAETVNCDRNGIRVIALTNLDDALGYDVKALMEIAIERFESEQTDKTETIDHLMKLTNDYFTMAPFNEILAAEFFPTREEAEHALHEVVAMLSEMVDDFETLYLRFKQDLSSRYDEAFEYLYYHTSGQSVVDTTPLGAYLTELRIKRNAAYLNLCAQDTLGLT